MIEMSETEVNRLEEIQRTINKQQTQKETACKLGLSIRQIKRLVKKYKEEGAKGLVSKHRGRKANNKIPTAVKDKALTLIKNQYSDFKPTFAHEKLTEIHQLNFSVETLRNWMVKDGLWQPKKAKKACIHQSRPRRSQRGILSRLMAHLMIGLKEEENIAILRFLLMMQQDS